MIALFWTKETWQAGIYAAISQGLTFEACEPGCGVTTWQITYTGGY